MTITTTPSVVTLTAGDVEYVEHGPADGQPVVFVHGFLVDEGLWGDVPALLAERGFRAVVPTWPLGGHRRALRADADLSPHGVARLVLELLEALDLSDVVLVGNDTGGGICQVVVDTDPSRIARLVLTNCDAFDSFPPRPFDLLFRLGRHPRLFRTVMTPLRSGRLRNGPFGFGLLTERRLDPAETRPWLASYLDDPGVRRDVATFLRGWSPSDLSDVSPRMAGFEKPVLICWAPADRFFTIELGRRLASTFPDARLVEIGAARTFVPLDQPAAVADAITEFLAS